jgi:hypothetical protein
MQDRRVLAMMNRSQADVPQLRRICFSQSFDRIVNNKDAEGLSASMIQVFEMQ